MHINVRTSLSMRRFVPVSMPLAKRTEAISGVFCKSSTIVNPWT